jgi:hypothetical protein
VHVAICVLHRPAGVGRAVLNVGAPPTQGAHSSFDSKRGVGWSSHASPRLHACTHGSVSTHASCVWSLASPGHATMCHLVGVSLFVCPHTGTCGLRGSCNCHAVSGLLHSQDVCFANLCYHWCQVCRACADCTHVPVNAHQQCTYGCLVPLQAAPDLVSGSMYVWVFAGVRWSSHEGLPAAQLCARRRPRCPGRLTSPLLISSDDDVVLPEGVCQH